ncbi:DUF2214 domain-containing protein [Stappia sp.]|uniref:DUF2214 domain-containing protein n=1 Tax=Stappia sp. TaxID=1870903 RepID=UPI003A99A589
METLTAFLQTLPVSEWMRVSRWGYALVNTAHVAGLAVLVGSILPLDLRLLGVWRQAAPLAPLVRVLVPCAACGLMLALSSGLMLFLAAPADYAAAPLFLAKMALVSLGTVSALLTHASAATRRQPGADMAATLAGLSPSRLRLAGAVSLIAWGGALICGRLLAFVAD